VIDPAYKNLKQYCYFSCLSEGALEAISQKLHEEEFSSGEEIIREGAPGDAFYLVSRGSVEVNKKNKWGQTAKISVAGHGEGFGEMALLTCSPRSCSVNAKTDVTLLKLLKTDFDEIVSMNSTFSMILGDRIKSYNSFNWVKTLQPFALLPPEKMSAFTSRLNEKEYSPGEKIITEGEKGDIYYIIKSGSVAVLKKSIEDEVQQVATLNEGEGFGEEALISNTIRNATVQAVDNTGVLTLSKKDFDEIMKSSFLEEITAEEVLSLHPQDVTYLDVRMKIEYDEEHIPDSKLLPLDELRGSYDELDRDKQYYVYCLSGMRSASASFLMNSQGFKAKNIKGGLLNWPGPVKEGSEGVHTPLDPT
jgi:CRP-like cAMP-binding protein